MIRSLRFRLILISMLAMLLVLCVMIGALNIINYRDIVTNADGMLNLLEAFGGGFPDIDYTGGELKEPSGSPPPIMDGFPSMPPDGRNKSGRDGRNEKRNFTPMSAETRFETRFFTVRLDGETATADTGNIAAVDTETAVDMAKQVLSSQRGFSGCYRYLVSAGENGKMVIFLDCTRELDSFYHVLYISVAASLGGLAAVFLLIFFFSGRVVRPMQESHEKQKQFITDAGHELKTPLTIIGADADVLESDIGENEWLSDIRTQTARLGKLTRDLTDLSRMEESNRPHMQEVFDLSALAADVLPSYRGRAVTRSQSLDTDIAPGLQMRGDREAIRRLIDILADNAVKYCPEGGSIRAEIKKEGRCIVVRVRNTAPGIASADLKRFFDRFYRGDASRSSDIPGYGLGLSIARAVTEAHKGRITATAPDQDTLLITVLLPAE